MGTISRHAGTPYVDGETLAGADLETDINNIVTECNGSLDVTNLSASANLVGTQLADGTIPTAKYANDSVTQPKILDGACSSSAVDDDDTSTALSAAYQTFATQAITTAADPGNVLIWAWIITNRATGEVDAAGSCDMRIRRDATTDIIEVSQGGTHLSGKLTKTLLPLNCLDPGSGLSGSTSYSYTIEAKSSLTMTVVKAQIIAVEFRR